MSKPKSLFGKSFKVLLLAAIVAGAIYLIVRNIDAFGNVLLVLLGFGVVILVHEFGHFISAKLCGIKVEMFSIGFPPILIGFKRAADGFRVRVLPGFFAEARGDDAEDDKGESGQMRDEGDKADDSLLSLTVGGKGRAWDTEYCVGLIPVGGFVKMLGQDDTGNVKASDDPRSFANKPVSARMAVIAAGVVCNVILAAIIFVAVFLIGIKQPPAVVGGIEPNSPAEHAGLQIADRIIEIDGKSKNIDMTDVMLAAALSKNGEKVKMKIDRTGEVFDLELASTKQPDQPLKTFGIQLPLSLKIAKFDEPKQVKELQAKTGLAPGDVIKSINGRPVEQYWDFEPIFEKTYTPTVKLLTERKSKNGKTDLIDRELALSWNIGDDVPDQNDLKLRHIHSMVPRLLVTKVNKVVRKGPERKLPGRILDRMLGLMGRKPAERETVLSDLKVGDVILAVGDVQNPTYNEMRRVTKEHEDKDLLVKVLRADASGDEKPVSVTVKPVLSAGRNEVSIGIALALDAAHPVVADTIAAGDDATKPTIPRGAVITAVDREPVSSFYDVVREIQKYPGEHITIDYRLNEENAGAVALTVASDDSAFTVKSGFAEAVPFELRKDLYKAKNPVDAIMMGSRKTVSMIAQTYLTIRRLIAGAVSPKSLMGPVGILAASYHTVADKMWIEYLFLIGLINAAIAVFNFLPLPPLDGGLAAFLVVEKIKGSAVSERTQGIIVRIGLAF
ncbi:MAG: site-2 protease family protein, partial [Sedimentisphaerales bacterium]|nr:site-2 protease family protein [Sedimentisphaerales bacterium]